MYPDRDLDADYRPFFSSNQLESVYASRVTVRICGILYSCFREIKILNGVHFPLGVAAPPHFQVDRDMVNLCSYLGQPSMALRGAAAAAAVAVVVAVAVAVAAAVAAVVVLGLELIPLLAPAQTPAVFSRFLRLETSALVHLPGPQLNVHRRDLKWCLHDVGELLAYYEVRMASSRQCMCHSFAGNVPFVVQASH